MSDEQFYKELQMDFYKESLDLIERFESVLLNNEVINNENINELFRIAHTVKGGSAAVGLNEISSYTHKVEDFLSQYKGKAELFTKNTVSLFLEFSDLLRVEFIAKLSDMENHWDPSRHLERIRNFSDEDAGTPVSSEMPTSEHTATETVPHSEEKSVEAAFEAATLAAVGEASTPSTSTPTPAPTAVAQATEVTPAAAPTPLVLHKTEPAAKPASPQAPAGASASPAATQQRAKKPNIQVKVDNDRLDLIFNTIGEVVVVKNQLKEHLLKNLNDPQSVELSESLDFIIKDLYDKALGLRLTSIQPLLQRLQRTLRDLSVQLNKEVHITIHGEETEIDRTLFEALGEPLIHLVRNAIDHGIETKDERAASGKTEKSHIQIKAYYLSGQVVIEIADNGRGIDAERIFLKSQMKGLIPESAKMADYTEEQIQNFILLPGFSTAETISDISGRGVGLDVVKTTVEKMMGKLAIKSKKGKGTTFLLYLPMTTSLIDGIVFGVNQSKYIVPVSSIKSIIQITKEHLTYSPDGEVFLNHLQKPTQVINVNQFLDKNFKFEAKDHHVVVISEINNVQTAFLFDEVLNQAQAVVKPLCDVQKRPEFIGAAVLGDGFTYLILDINSIQLTYAQKANAVESKTPPKKNVGKAVAA